MMRKRTSPLVETKPVMVPLPSTTEQVPSPPSKSSQVSAIIVVSVKSTRKSLLGFVEEFCFLLAVLLLL